MSNSRIEVVVEGPTQLGEGPHWSPAKQQLYFVDIFRQFVHRYDPVNRSHSKIHLDGGPVSMVVPVENQHDKYIVSEGRGLSLVEWNGMDETPKSVKPLLQVDDHSPNNRFNDGKCDPSGRLWAGTMGSEPVVGQLDRKKGALYTVDKDLKVCKHFNEIDIANGLAWTKDNSIMYYIDSKTYRIDAFDFDIKKGTISNRRTAFDFEATNTVGLPDGMTIDTDGKLWIACFFGGQVIQVDPEIGRVINRIEMPCANVTSAMFGGPHLDMLYVTSAQHGLSVDDLGRQPRAGSLFQITNTGARGFPATDFSGNV